MAQNKFVPTEAFEHRYARRDALLDILQKPPFSFKEREIQIHASQGSGFQVKLPRKLRSEEREQIIEALDHSMDSNT